VQLAPGSLHIVPIHSDRRDDLHVNFSGDVLIPFVRMKLSGDLHASLQMGNAIVNGMWSDRKMFNQGLNLRLSSGWKGRLNLEASMSLDNARFRDIYNLSSQEFSNWSTRLKAKIRCRWNDRWYGALSGERVSMPGLPPFLAIDCHWSWQCSERLSVSLTGQNLLDQRNAVTRWVGAGAEGGTVFRVVQRYLLVKFTWALG
jgi:hypothetical protein